MFFEPFGHVEDINLRILNLKLECFCSGHFTLCGNSSELSLFILSKWMVMVTKKNCNTQNKLPHQVITFNKPENGHLTEKTILFHICIRKSKTRRKKKV